MAKRGVTAAGARKLALAIDGAIEKPSYGTPGFRVRDALFARLLPDGASLVVRVEPEQRELLLENAPAIFSVTPHYQDYPWVIVRLDAIAPALLADLLTEAAALASSTKRRPRRP